MSILRTAQQVAFNDLLVAVEESIDDYADLAGALHDPAVSEAFHAFAQQRKSIVARLQAEIRRLDDLPSLPDADKEDLGRLVHRVRAALAADELPQAVQEMLEAEQHILELVRVCEREELDQLESALLDDLVAQIDSTVSRLRLLATEISRPGQTPG